MDTMIELGREKAEVKGKHKQAAQEWESRKQAISVQGRRLALNGPRMLTTRSSPSIKRAHRKRKVSVTAPSLATL
jgi:hypothetical protein